MRPWSLSSSSSASPSRSVSCRFATASTRGATTTRTSSSRSGQARVLVLRRLPQALGVAPLALLLEAPFPRRLRRCGGGALAPRAGGLPHLLEHALDGELAVAKLRALVLGDRAHDPAEPVEDAAPLVVAQPFRGFDV